MVDSTLMALLLATILGSLFGLIVAIRRLMTLELKQEKLLNTIKRIELRDISMEERTYKILERIESMGTKKKTATKKTTKKKK